MNYSNKYGSKVDSFAAFDMYNLPMPALPPADLTIAAGGIISTYMSFRNSNGSRVVDFDPNDNPYVRSLGLSSNLADGLVDAASAHYGGATAWQGVIRPLRVSADLTGTITTIASSALVTGNGTVFTQELAVGSTITWIDDNKVQRQAIVLLVNADAGAGALTLTAALPAVNAAIMGTAIATAVKANQLVGQAGYAGGSVTIPFLQMNVMYPFAFFAAQASLIYSPQGKITATAGSAVVTGVGTKFLTEMVQNGSNGSGYVIGWTDNLGIRRTGVVTSIASETSLTLTAVVPAGQSGTNVVMLDLDASLRIRCEMPYTFFAYTIAIDPAFGSDARRLSLSILAEIEHTSAMIGEL